MGQMATNPMNREPRRILLTLSRCLRLKCPACGQASIVQRLFHLKHRCDFCGVIFKREEGFFVGAIMANVIATEGVILLAYFACILFTSVADQTMLAILFAIGVTFPLAFYHHAWALWLGLDHLIEGLSRKPTSP